jgi:hypothetical protein
LGGADLAFDLQSKVEKLDLVEGKSWQNFDLFTDFKLLDRRNAKN